MTAQREGMLPTESLVVLTHDNGLVETLRGIDTAHTVIAVRAESELAAQLINAHAGVAFVDAAVVTGPVQQLTERLKSQFPDLVLIVAGGPADQGALTQQITKGAVYRFLHKPVSAQRVRLFVEAAWRRHNEEHAAAGEPSAPAAARPDEQTTLPRNALIAGGIILAVLVVVGGWLMTHRSEEGRSPTLSASARPQLPPAVHDEELEKLLVRADQALAAGALVAPAGRSAADLYARALQRNGADPRPANGIEKVIDKLLSAAQEQLTAQHLDAAQKLTDQARAIKPDHVRVAFLTAQLGKERERALLAQARQAASGGNVERAIAVLDSASHQGDRSTTVVEARQELEQQKSDERVGVYLAKATERMNSGQLVEPAEDNARFFVESARALAPEDAQVHQAERQLTDSVLARARKALTDGNVDEAQHWIQAASESGVSREDLTELNREEQHLQTTAKADAMARLAMLFDQRLAQGHLVDPATDSAKFYLTQLQQADANHPSTVLARQAMATRTLDEAKNSVQHQDFTAAQRWLAEARGDGADDAHIKAVEQDMTLAEDTSKQASSFVTAASLELTHYAPPDFPLSAREQGVSGWVDMQFVVKPDGSLSDLHIIGSTPPGVFEEAAIEAVRKWRYRPVLRDGQAVAQPARLRLKFTLKN
jgi:protein TonB